MKPILRIWCWLAGHRFTVRYIARACSWDAVAGTTQSGSECSRCGKEQPDA